MNFNHYLQQKNMLPPTIARHQREVNRYQQWLNNHCDAAADTATQKQLLHYLQHLKQHRNLCHATLNQLLQILKNYYAYLAKYQHCHNITAFINLRNTHHQQLHYLFTANDLDELCDAYYHFTRNCIPSIKQTQHHTDYEQLLQGRYLAVTLIIYQALQVQEIENLTAASFDLRKGTVTIAASRKAAKRILNLQPLQIGALLNYYNNVDTLPLVPNRNHFDHINAALKTLHPHYQHLRQLRAACITHWLQQHGLRNTQYLAGHRSITSTQKYQAANLQTLHNSLQQYHPLH
jgi:site-specific recombinase XerD